MKTVILALFPAGDKDEVAVASEEDMADIEKGEAFTPDNRLAFEKWLTPQEAMSLGARLILAAQEALK